MPMGSVARPRLLRAALLGFLSFSLGCLCPSIMPEPPPNEESWPSWAPDGERMVYECYLDGPVDSPGFIDRLFEAGGRLSFYTPEAADLCISDVSKHDQMRLTDDPGGDWHPAWSPDSSQIAYLREDGIYLITSEGQNRRKLVPLDSVLTRLSWWRMRRGVVAWSPEGRRLLFSGCLDHWDHDVYVVDVGSGTIVNLTPSSRVHDFAPMWTLDGSKIVFLSTDSSSPYGCGPDDDALPQIRVVNADGSDGRVVYDPEFYYPYWQVSVSNSGQIAIVTNMTSRTYDEYYDAAAETGNLYGVDLVEGIPREVLLVEGDEEFIALPAWSPDEEHLAYIGYLSDLRLVEVKTGKVLEARERLSIDNRFVWSPDSQRIAVTVSTVQDLAIDSEQHIHVFDVRSRTFEPLVQE